MAVGGFENQIGDIFIEYELAHVVTWTMRKVRHLELHGFVPRFLKFSSPERIKECREPPPDAVDRGKIDKRVNTFTVIGTAGYAFHPRWDISFGAGKGLADDENSGEALEFTDGDWSGGGSTCPSVSSTT